MSDLISRSALMKKIAHHTVYESLKRVTFESANTYEQVKGDMFRLVQKAPAVNDVEVVRCKDCALRGDLYRCPMRTLVMPGQGPGTIEDQTEDEGYCHKGKRKE